MNRSWKNKPHSGRGPPFRGGRGRGWNNKFYGRPPPLLETPMATNNKYRFINPNQHRRYYEEQMAHQYEYPPNHGNPSWGHHNRNNFEYKHQNFHHFVPPHPPPPLMPLNSPRLARPPSPLPGSEEYIQREINEKSEYLKRHLALAVPPEENFLEDTDISNFSDNLYKVVPSNKIYVSDIDSENETMQKNEIVRKQHKPMRQHKSHNVLNVNEIHSKILNHISNMSFGQKVNLVNQVTPTSYDVALHQINRQKRLELSKALRDMCNDQLKEVQNSTEIINSIIPDFDIKIEELPIELVEQLSTTLNENLSEVVQDCSVDPELFFQQAAEMLNTSLEIENSNSKEVNFNRDNYDNFMEEIPNDEATEAQFQNVENSNVPSEFEENIFENQSFLPPTLIDFPVQNDDSNNLNSKSMSTEMLDDDDLLPSVQNDDLLPPVQNEDFTPDELYGNERNDSNNLNSNLVSNEPLEDDLLPNTVNNEDFTVDDDNDLYDNERNDGSNLNSKSVLNEPLDDDLLLPSVQNDDLTADEFYENETNCENLPSTTEEEQNPPLLSDQFEFDHETESLLNFEETSQYRNPWFNPSPPPGKDETENFLSTVIESPPLARQESPQTLTDPSWDLPTIEESNVNFGEACQDEEENHILESNLNFINKPCPDEEESPIIESNLDFINKPCPDEVESQISESNLQFINKPCPDVEESQIIESNRNYINKPCSDEKQSQIVESNLNEACRNEEQNQFVIQAIKPVVSFLNDEINQINVLRDDVLVESNMAGINKTRYEEEVDNNYRSSESSSTENTDRLSSESSKNCSPEKDYKREQERFRKMQKRNYYEERRSHKYRTKYVDEKREKRGEERLRGRDFEEGRRYAKDRWNRDTRHPKRYYRDELHPHRLEYEDENAYVHNKYKNSHLRSKSNYYHSYEEYSRKHKDSKDYKKPEKLKSDVLKDRIDKKLISRSTSEESNSKSLQKSLKDRIEVMLKHSTKSACEDAKSEESLVLQNAETEVEQHREDEEKIESRAIKKKNVKKKRSSYKEVAPVALKVCSKIKKKTMLLDPEIEEFILKKEIEMDLSQDGVKVDDNDKCSKSEDISLEKETQQLQEDDDPLLEENLSPPYTPPLLNHFFAQQEQVTEEAPTIVVVPSLSPRKTIIQDHVKQTPPKIWRSPGEKKFMMELYPPKLEQNLVVAKTSIETTQLCSKPDQATHNGHLVVLTNRTNPLSFSETNTSDIVAELENCINSMTKRTAIDILNSSEVSSTSDTLKLQEKFESKRITKPLHQHLEIGKNSLDKIIETDKSENCSQIKTLKQTTSTQTNVKQKSAAVQVMQNLEVQSMSTGIQTNSVVAFENNNEIFEVSPTASGINRKLLKATHKKKVVQRMREIDKEIERLTKLRQSLYNYITSDNDSDNDQTTSSAVKSSESGKRKRNSSVKSKSSKKSRRDSPNSKIRHETTVDSVEEVSEKRSRSHLSRKSNTSDNRETLVSVAASKDIAVSEKRSESSLSHKSKASENLERAASVESHQRTEKAEKRSESSLSHRSRASENRERCPSVESHGKVESKDGVTERRSESSSSHKSKASDCLEGCVSVDNSGMGLTTKGVAISEKTERRSNSSSSHKSKTSENHKRGASKESIGKAESKDNVDKKPESSFSHKGSNEINTSRETRKRDASKDKVEKLPESSASSKNDVSENREKSSSIVSHKRTTVISDKIVKKSRSSHKSSALENREKDTSTESYNKAPYVVIKKIVQTPESNLSHNNERVESLEKQKETHKVKNKSNLGDKCIAPETPTSNVAPEIQNASSENIGNIPHSDSDVVKQKAEKSKIKKIVSSPIRKSRRRSYVRKSRNWRKRGKNLEKVKNVKIDGATAKPESPTAAIHENVTDISSVEAAATIDNSSVLFAENVTNIESTFSMVSVSDSTNVSLGSTVASLSDVPSVSCATICKIISSVSPSVITESDTRSVSPVTVNRSKMKRSRERKSNNQYSKTIQEVAKETTDTLKSTEILPIVSSISSTSAVGSTADVMCTLNSVISKSDAELVPPKLPEVVSRVTASRSKTKGPRGRKQNNQYTKTIEEVAKEKTVLDNPEAKSEIPPISSSISCTATVSSAADDSYTPTVNSISNVAPATNVEAAVISELDSKLDSPKLPEAISRFTAKRSKMKGPRARKQNNQYSKTIEEVAKEKTEVTSEILPIGSSISCTATVSGAADISYTPTVTSISNVSPAANVKTAVISESDAKLVSPILSESVPAIIPNRSKMKGSRGRKSNQQYSKTIEEVVKENTEITVLDNLEAKNEIPPVNCSVVCTATVSSTADVSCTPTVKTISNVSPAANIKTAVISSELDTELVSPMISEIVSEVVSNRSKLKGPRGRKSNKQYSKTIEEVVKESVDVPVMDNLEPTSEILPITSSVSSVSCAATPVKSVSNAVITESDAELVSSKLLEVVSRVTTNRSKMKGPRGRKSNNHYSETIEQVIKEKLDVPLLDDPEPTNEMPPITSSVSYDVVVKNISSGTGVINESNAELVLPTLETVPQITPNCVKMKGPKGRKTSSQNSKANKEVAKETIDLPVLDNPEAISDILLISGDDSFNENEMRKRPGKRRRDVDPTAQPEVQKKFKASKRRNSNKMNSMEIVGKINMFPVVSLPRCEELEFKLKDLSNTGYISNDCEENVSSPAEMLPAKKEVEDESTKMQQENSTDEATNATKMILIASCPTVDENYEINFSGFTGAILVIKVIASTAIAASDKGKLFWFNLLTGELLSTHHLSNLPITSIIVVKRNNESVMYVGSLDTSITIMNFEKNAIVKKTNVDEPIQCMELAWNSIFIGSDRGSLITYDLKTEQVVEDIKISESNVLMIRATQEGPRKVLVIATRNALVSIRDAKTGLLLRTMETPFLPTVYTLLFDKNLIYCGTSQHDILVYTFEDGQLIFKHEATKSKGVVCMQIVGNLLFAGCYNGNIYVYNTKTNVYLGTMCGPGGLMLSMEIVQDKIIVGTKSSNFKAWRIPQKYLDQN